MIYKTNESIIIIQAEAIQPISTGVVFWSYDRGTAELRFKLQKNGLPQSLPEGTMVPIRLIFKSTTAEGGYGKHDYLATIEDRLNGIVSIVLEDNILGYQGRVDGSIYIDFPNNQSLDTAGRFTFDIKRSPIDDSTPELEDYYFNGFSQTIDKIEKIVAQTKSEIDQAANDVTKKINAANTSLKELNESLEVLEGNIKEGEQHFVTKSSTEKGLMIYRSQFVTAENWNDIQDSGIYYCAGATGENMPIKDTLYGYLIVIKSAGIVIQQFLSNGVFFMRAMIGNPMTWNPWTKFPTDGAVVHVSGNESIDGFKNFLQTPTVNDTPVALERFVSKTVKTTNTTDFTNESSVKFERWGRLVVANFAITNKSANFPGWKNLMAFPKGYAPIALRGWGGTLANKTNRNPALSVYANASGIAVMVSTTNLPENQECSGTVSYFTNDVWPN